jgi:hypothetical protein
MTSMIEIAYKVEAQLLEPQRAYARVRMQISPGAFAGLRYNCTAQPTLRKGQGLYCKGQQGGIRRTTIPAVIGTICAKPPSLHKVSGRLQPIDGHVKTYCGHTTRLQMMRHACGKGLTRQLRNYLDMDEGNFQPLPVSCVLRQGLHLCICWHP